MPVDNDQLIAYAKATPDATTSSSCVVNLDPHHTQSGWLELDLAALGPASRSRPYQMHDLLTDAHFLWHGARNFVMLDPQRCPAHVMRLRARLQREQRLRLLPVTHSIA